MSVVSHTTAITGHCARKVIIDALFSGSSQYIIVSESRRCSLCIERLHQREPEREPEERARRESPKDMSNIFDHCYRWSDLDARLDSQYHVYMHMI